MKARYVCLAEDEVRRWFDNLAARSYVTANVYLRSLGLYCELNGTNPKAMLEIIGLEAWMASQTFRRLKIERRLKGSFLIVSLMGADGKRPEERRWIKGRLKELGIIAIIAEDDLPKDVAPSLVEEHVLKSGDVENVISETFSSR